MKKVIGSNWAVEDARGRLVCVLQGSDARTVQVRAEVVRCVLELPPSEPLHLRPYPLPVVHAPWFKEGYFRVIEDSQS